MIRVYSLTPEVYNNPKLFSEAMNQILMINNREEPNIPFNHQRVNEPKNEYNPSWHGTDSMDTSKETFNTRNNDLDEIKFRLTRIENILNDLTELIENNFESPVGLDSAHELEGCHCHNETKDIQNIPDIRQVVSEISVEQFEKLLFKSGIIERLDKIDKALESSKKTSNKKIEKK